jgi:hypothetical protein
MGTKYRGRSWQGRDFHGSVDQARAGKPHLHRRIKLTEPVYTTRISTNATARAIGPPVLAKLRQVTFTTIITVRREGNETKRTDSEKALASNGYHLFHIHSKKLITIRYFTALYLDQVMKYFTVHCIRMFSSLHFAITNSAITSFNHTLSISPDLLI